MLRFLIPLFLFSIISFGEDYFTVEILRTSSYNSAQETTKKYKDLGFDAFTQIRPGEKGDLYLSCINKFKTRENAQVFVRNLDSLKYFSDYKISFVLSKEEWLARFGSKEKDKRVPAKTNPQSLNPSKLPVRKPAAIDPYKPNSFQGTPSSAPIENPLIKGQKFVSTSEGLFVSVPTSSGDYWKQINTHLNLKNAKLFFTKDGTLWINNYKLDARQKDFKIALDPSLFHLEGHRVRSIYKKDGLLWYVFEKDFGERKPAGDLESKKRVFISSDLGLTFSELPGIIRKDM